MIRPTVNTLAPSSVVMSSLQHPICWEMSVVGNKVTDLGQHSTAYHSCMVSMSGGLHVGCHNSAPAQIRGHIAPPTGTTRSASHAVRAERHACWGLIGLRSSMTCLHAFQPETPCYAAVNLEIIIHLIRLNVDCLFC